MNQFNRIDYEQQYFFENLELTPIDEGLYKQKGKYCFYGNQHEADFFIHYQNGNLRYIKNGVVLKISFNRVPINDIKNPPKIIFDLEQVKNLQWEGEIGDQEQCIGQWKAKWNGQNLSVGGFYNDFGIKIGKWSELGNHTYNEDYLIHKGEYNWGKKISIWETLLQDRIIGFGVYNKEGIKNGKWFEPIQSYSNLNIAIWIGNYNKGKKIGYWNAIYKKSQCHNDFMPLGGGNYTKDGVKNGYWIDFDDTNQGGLFAVKIGQYSIGNKIGKWIIQYQDQIIGGGYYDEQGQKVGNWVEVHEKFNWYIFNQFLIHCQITFHGFYKNGKRNGFWQYFYYLTLLMGHGRFDENGVKQGKWVELFQNFWSSCQITEEGEYQNGKRVGLWYTIENNKIISGGIYNDKEQKNGIWRDLHENFSCFCEISYEGQYKSGIKVGYWKTIFQSEQHVGGGNYDEKGIRNGRWADLDENFNRNFGTSFVQYIQNYECGLKKGELTQQPFR